MAKKFDLIPLAKTDYQKLEPGDVFYDGFGKKWKITTIKYSKRNPTSRVISAKYGMYRYGKVQITAKGPDTPLFKEKGTRYHSPKSPKKGVNVGSRVSARVPISEGIYKGAKVIKVGTRGTVLQIRTLTPEQSKQYHHGEKAMLSVKFDKGGTMHNVYPTQVRPV